MSKFLGDIRKLLVELKVAHASKETIFFGAVFLCAFSFMLSTSVMITPTVKGAVEVYHLSSAVPMPSRKPMKGMNGSIQVAMALPKDLELKELSDLTRKQVEIAAQIFDLQSQDKIKEANRYLAKLSDKDLRGHVLAQRYIESRNYISSYKELKSWLKQYTDLPQATDVYKLAVRKGGAEGLAKPKVKAAIAGNIVTQDYTGKIYQSRQNRTKAETKAYFNLKNRIKEHVQVKEPTQALNLLNKESVQKLVDDVEYDRLRAEIAAGYLYANRLKHALRLSQASLERSGNKVPQAGWVKGLVKWQEGKYLSAAKAFEVAANSPYSTGWMVASSSYWSSRAYLRAGHKNKIRPLVEQAATYPHSFYGVIANYALGNQNDYNWKIPRLNKNHLETLLKTEEGARALKLVRAQQIALAEQELKYLLVKRNAKLKESLLAFANHYQLAGLLYKLGHAVQKEPGQFYDAALYPDMAWSPDNGYKVDKALIHAIIRQESRFDVSAKNASGATGLMQLMPRTAKYIARKTNEGLAKKVSLLHEPMTNISFGQNYIHYLLNHRVVGQDLLSLAMAYNAGPGTLSKWKRDYAHIDDPLLFIEVIPFRETRAFVERVMTNFWMYRMRYDQKLYSLDNIAEGEWARYVAQDAGLVDIAMR